jgi:hypothetical protein
LQAPLGDTQFQFCFQSNILIKRMRADFVSLRVRRAV